jgi:Xaa-Pro aminopeptidase
MPHLDRDLGTLRARGRPAVTWQFMSLRAAEVARSWVANVQQLLRELGADDGPLGLDRLDTVGFTALHEAGVPLVDSSAVTMAAREVKTPQEVELLKLNGPIGDAVLRDFEDPPPRCSRVRAAAEMTDSLLRRPGERISRG